MKMKTFVTLFAVGALFASCEDADYSVITNRVYISEAVGLDQQIFSLTVDGDVDFDLTVRLAEPTDRDVTVRLDVDDAMITEYNNANNTTYETLPEQYIEFAKEVVIPAGKTSAPPLQVTIKQFKAPGVSYALPIRIVSADGADVMAKTARMLYRLSAPHYQKTVVVSRANHAEVAFAQALTSNTWTLEFWVNISDFTSRSKIFDGCELMGYGSFFLRYWNPGAIKPGKPCLQWQGNGVYFDSPQFWDDRTWYHLAYVSDGSKVALYVDGELSVTKDTDAAQTFNTLRIGKGSYYWGSVTASLAQIRIWNKALSVSTIKDAMNREVAADTEGLFGYWKCDEGTGSVLKDSSSNGNDLTLAGTPAWTEELNFSHLK